MSNILGVRRKPHDDLSDAVLRGHTEDQSESVYAKNRPQL